MDKLVNRCSTFSNVSVASALDIQSLLTMRFQQWAFILWILTAVANIMSSIVTIVVIRATKILRTDTLSFMHHSNVAVSLGSCSFAICAIIHLVHIAQCVPETMSRYRCFLYIGHQSLLLSMVNTFMLAIAFDRLIASILPIKYKNRPHWYKNGVLAVIYAFEGSLYILSFLDTPDHLVSVCVYVIVEGDNFFFIMVTKLMSFSVLSLICYLIIAIKLKLDANRVQAIDTSVLGQIGTSANKDNQPKKNNTNNLNQIKNRANKKVLRALMINTIAQSTTFLIAYSKLIHGLSKPNRDVSVMPFFVNLMMIDAFVNFIIYMIFVEAFRNTLFNKETWCSLFCSK